LKKYSTGQVRAASNEVPTSANQSALDPAAWALVHLWSDQAPRPPARLGFLTGDEDRNAAQPENLDRHLARLQTKQAELTSFPHSIAGVAM
jgi:hypothetical protein